jgi:putative endonuclease
MKRISFTPDTLLGQAGEQYAEQFLSDEGLILIERNFKKPCGEIDLIMLEQQTFVFVEVKLRKHKTQVSALEAVDKRKQKRLIKTAHWYLQTLHSQRSPTCRFDVVAINHNCRNNAFSVDSPLDIKWIKNAFYAE